MSNFCVFFQPSNVKLHEKFYSHPPLLPGEQIISQHDHVTCVDTFSDIAQGILHITTYRVIFAGNHAEVLVITSLTSTRINIQNMWIQKISIPPTEGLLVCTPSPPEIPIFALYYSLKLLLLQPPPSSWTFH